jgi:serine/threonine protein kinase
MSPVVSPQQVRANGVASSDDAQSAASLKTQKLIVPKEPNAYVDIFNAYGSKEGFEGQPNRSHPKPPERRRKLKCVPRTLLPSSVGSSAASPSPDKKLPDYFIPGKICQATIEVDGKKIPGFTLRTQELAWFLKRDPVGAGGYAKVFCSYPASADGKIDFSATPVAVKNVQKRPKNMPQGLSPERQAEYSKQYLEETRQSLEIERTALSRCDHKNVLKLEYNHIIETPGSFSLILEFVQGRELFEVIVEAYEKNRSYALPEQIAFGLFSQILTGIKHIHSKDLRHRDLKPENIMLDNKGQIKITDFGLAQIIPPGSNDDKSTKALGSLPYAPPEIILERGPFSGACIDSWTAMLTFRTMLTGTPMFKDPLRQIPDALRGFQAKDGRWYSWSDYTRLPKEFSDEANAFVQWGLNPHPDQRPTVPMFIEALPKPALSESRAA